MTDDLRERPPSHLPIAGGTYWRRKCVTSIQRCNHVISELKSQREKEKNPTAQAWLADRIIEQLEIRADVEMLLNYFQDRPDEKRDEKIQRLVRTNELVLIHLAPTLPDDVQEQVRQILYGGEEEEDKHD
jgi:hypothetical protein